MPKLVLLGAGGHARVIVEILKMEGRYEVAGVVGPQQLGVGEMAGVQWLGEDESLPKLRDEVRHIRIGHCCMMPAT